VAAFAWEETVYLEDKIDPEFTKIPVQTPRECNPPAPYANYAAFTAAGGLAFDNCSLNTASFSHLPELDQVLENICPRIIVRTYKIEDMCGNIATFTDTLEIYDNTPPQASNLPPAGTFNCIGEYPPDVSLVKATDNCSQFVVTHLGDSPDPGCKGTVIRTYRVSDICNNYVDVVQTITIDNKLKPSVDVIPPIRVDCTLAGPYRDMTEFLAAGGSIVNDNCHIDAASLTLKHLGDSYNGESCPATYTRTYSVTDECGNETTFTQTIQTNDTEDPAILCPPDLLDIPYTQIPLPYTIQTFVDAGGLLDDNCGIKSLTYVTTDSTRVDKKLFLTREYTVTDWCDNTAVCLHRITADIESPVLLNCPPVAGITVNCYGELPPPFENWSEFLAGGGSANSLFGIDTTSFRLIFQSPPMSVCQYDVLRTYEITDMIGQVTTCTQTFRIHDRIPPVVSCPPPIIVQPGGSIPAPYYSVNTFISAGGIAYDNCELLDRNPYISETPKSGCAADTLVRLYRFTDRCGSTSCTHRDKLSEDHHPHLYCC
jgi:large repetitive protein